MQAMRVMKHHYIIQNILLCFIPGLVISSLQTLQLQAAKEAFYRRVIPTGAFPAHAALEAISLHNVDFPDSLISFAW
jgi:hypothetical protein